MNFIVYTYPASSILTVTLPHLITTQYLKLEEVSEQSRLHQWQIERRGSLLAVMLHHTIRHDDKEEGSTATGSSNGSGDVGTFSMDVIDPAMDLS